MSIYKLKPFDFSRVRTYPLKERSSKVQVGAFAKPFVKGGSFADFLATLPEILAASELRAVVGALFKARQRKRGIVWGLGGHVIKVGLAPILIDLARRGYASGFALNGSGIIHDFEIALVGATSEDVEAELGRGTFGMAEETGRMLNEAIARGAKKDIGIGEAVGQLLNELDPQFAEQSLLVQAYKLAIPVTAHVAIGTDIIHNHPAASGDAIGKASFADFRLFTSLVAGIDDGGVYINVGSAVILPEVFLKAVTLIRNSGMSLKNFTAVNMDFIQHYRPVQNVLIRPTKDSGRGIALTGHHEIMLPLLAAALIEQE